MCLRSVPQEAGGEGRSWCHNNLRVRGGEWLARFELNHVALTKNVTCCGCQHWEVQRFRRDVQIPGFSRSGHWAPCPTWHHLAATAWQSPLRWGLCLVCRCPLGPRAQLPAPPWVIKSPRMGQPLTKVLLVVDTQWATTVLGWEAGAAEVASGALSPLQKPASSQCPDLCRRGGQKDPLSGPCPA